MEYFIWLLLLWNHLEKMIKIIKIIKFYKSEIKSNGLLLIIRMWSYIPNVPYIVLKINISRHNTKYVIKSWIYKWLIINIRKYRIFLWIFRKFHILADQLIYKSRTKKKLIKICFINPVHSKNIRNILVLDKRKIIFWMYTMIGSRKSFIIFHHYNNIK